MLLFFIIHTGNVDICITEATADICLHSTYNFCCYNDGGNWILMVALFVVALLPLFINASGTVTNIKVSYFYCWE